MVTQRSGDNHEELQQRHTWVNPTTHGGCECKGKGQGRGRVREEDNVKEDKVAEEAVEEAEARMPMREDKQYKKQSMRY